MDEDRDRIDPESSEEEDLEPLDEGAGTAWAVEPERIDPDDYPPSSPFVREMTWAPCRACEIQVHSPVAQFVYQGLTCPRCGTLLLSPPEDPEYWIQRVLREEDELSEQL